LSVQDPAPASRRSRTPAGWLALSPMIGVGMALALLAISIGLAVHNEGLNRQDRIRQFTVQADILAASVAAPLAFDDDKAAREYVNAMRVNPDIRAVGAYDAAGRLAAGYAGTGQPPPTLDHLSKPAFHGSELVITEPVMQQGARLGAVYLEVSTEPWARRLPRYLGIAVVMGMASLLVAVLGASYASMSRAHNQLRRETEGRRKAEEALRQSQKMEAMGQLTGGVAHDFNNMLMAASSGLELMDRTNDPVRREKLRQGIRQALDRGARLTQQLLAFARRSPLNPEVVDLSVRLAGMDDLLDRSLRGDISVETHADQPLWPVEVDPSQFEVAVLNIAINARDAMPQGGRIIISLTNRPAGPDEPRDLVEFSMRDTGEGVPQDLLPRLFEPFFTTKGVGQGTGLGLSQVYGFAQASSGEARVASTPGQGTTITLLLPRCAKPLTAQVTEAVPTAADIQGEPRILVVEDDAAVAEMALEMIRSLGYRPTHAANADRALETLAADAAFAAVFSDMVMPGALGGLELAQEIRKRHPDLPVILTTGYSAAAAQATASGLTLLTKPYGLDALARELGEAVRGGG
jgi:signal transduction histidine kinase